MHYFSSGFWVILLIYFQHCIFLFWHVTFFCCCCWIWRRLMWPLVRTQMLNWRGMLMREALPRTNYKKKEMCKDEPGHIGSLTNISASCAYFFHYFMSNWEKSFSSIGKSPRGSRSTDREEKKSWAVIFYTIFLFLFFWINNYNNNKKTLNFLSSWDWRNLTRRRRKEPIPYSV